MEAEEARERFADRLDHAPLSVWRFIDVNEGTKGTYDHTQRTPDDPSLSGNYGIYGGRGAQHYEECIGVPRDELSETDRAWDCECTCGAAVLVDVDVDDGQAFVESGALEHAPATLRVKSPHAGLGDTATEEDVEGHHFYRVPGAVEEVEGAINDLMTGDSVNPAPSWGEVRVFNQFVVGPGSEITDCDKDWHDCSPADEGHYRLVDDRPIETLTPEELIELLCASGDYPESSQSGESSDTEDTEIGGDENADGETETGTDPSTVLKRYPWIGEYLSLGRADDRSEQDFAVCCALVENGVCESDAYELLNGSRHTKVNERGRNYWRKTWQKAQQQADTAEDSGRGGVDENGVPQPPLSSGIECRNGSYGYTKQTQDGDVVWEEATNFQLEAESFLIEGDGEDSVELTVHPAKHGQPYTRTVPMTVFNEVRNFKDRVVTARGTAYSGGSDMLNKIRKFVGGQDAPVRTGVEHIGLHQAGDVPEWVTPNGVLTADGWSDDPDSVLTRQDTALANKWGLDPEDGIDYAEEDVRSILRLLPQMRPSERFLPALGWFYAAPFRPLIMNEFGEGEFNLLNVVGNSGSGKSGTLEALVECFGMDGEPFRADGTPFPLMKAMAATNALPVVFDEYKPADMTDYRVDNLKSYLRTSSRGGIEQKGNPDQTVNEYRLIAPVCIAGEQPLKGTAEERRSIQTAFTRRPTKDHTRTCEMFHRLTGGEHNGEYHEGFDLLDHARAYYQWMLALDTDELHAAWRDARETTTEVIDELDLSGLDELVEQGYQTVAFGMMIYRRFARDMGADIDGLPVTESDVKVAIEYLADEGTGAEHRSNVDRLLGLAGRASAADYLERDEHYTFVREGDEDEELVIRLQTAFDAIRKYVRDYDITGEDLLDTVEDYQSRFRDEQERENSYILTSSKKARPIGYGTAFDLVRACDRVEGLSRRMFTDSEAVGDDDGTDEDSDVLDIGSLEAGDRVTATVVTRSVLQNPPQWLDGEGMFLTDEGQKIGYHERGSLPDIEVGVEYHLTDAVVSTADGETVLELREGMTEVVPVESEESDESESDDEQAVEATPEDGSDSDGNEETTASDDDADGGESDIEHADGPPSDAEGVTADAARVLNTIRQVENGDAVDRVDLAVELDGELHHEQIDPAISKLLKDGRITEPEQGCYRPV